MRPRPNPLVPGFNPDPSVVLVKGAYYLVTSSFEYLPGLPVYRSTDLVSWTHIGNVATRPEQVRVEDVPTVGGVWAPTIRYHDGMFYVIVTVMLSPRGCVVFAATDPAGPWSDGTRIEGLDGIDPDLAWDDEGTAYVTYSALRLSEEHGTHMGIEQARVDLDGGRMLEEPRSLWSGTGLYSPEAPHLYQRGDFWYLVIAEGGTERGHAVSIARGRSPQGPFEGHPANPVLSARSTGSPVQNTGHGDLVTTPEGGTALVLLGVRPLGATRGFSPLGRETFITDVDWIEEWPVPRPVELAPGPGLEESFDFSDPATLEDPGWLAVRRTPSDVASMTATPGRLTIRADGATLEDPRPAFVGRRQRHLLATVSTRVDAAEGAGGLAARYAEGQYVALDARRTSAGTEVTARATMAGLTQTWRCQLPGGEVELAMTMTPPPKDHSREAQGGDRIRLTAAVSGEEHVLAELDGRLWSAETCVSFAGRILGLYALEGTVTFGHFHYRGSDSPASDLATYASATAS